MSHAKVHAMEMAIFVMLRSLCTTSLMPSLPSMLHISRNASASPNIAPMARLPIKLSIFFILPFLLREDDFSRVSMLAFCLLFSATKIRNKSQSCKFFRYFILTVNIFFI